MKKGLLMACVALLAAGALFATGTQETAPVKQAEPAKTEPVQIEFWHNYANKQRAEFIDQVAAEFNEQNPGVVITPKYIGSYAVISEQIAGAAAAGKGLPGLSTINCPRVLNFAASGLIEPVGPLAEKTGAGLDDYYPGILDSISDKEGTLYAVPFGISAAVLYYNKGWLDEVGLPLPETWDEFKTWCREFHEKTGKAAFSFPYDFNNINTMVLNATGKDMLGDGTKSALDDPDFLQFALDVRDLVQNGDAVWSGTKIDQAKTEMANLMANREVAAYCDTITNYLPMLPLCDFPVSLRIGFVKHPGDKEVSTTSGSGLVIYADNPEPVKEASFRFATYLTNAENNAKWAVDTCMFPVRKSVAEKGLLTELYRNYPAVEYVFERTSQLIPKNKSSVMQKATSDIVTTIGEIAKGNVADPAAEWEALRKKTDQTLAEAL